MTPGAALALVYIRRLNRLRSLPPPLLKSKRLSLSEGCLPAQGLALRNHCNTKPPIQYSMCHTAGSHQTRSKLFGHHRIAKSSLATTGRIRSEQLAFTGSPNGPSGAPNCGATRVAPCKGHDEIFKREGGPVKHKSCSPYIPGASLISELFMSSGSFPSRLRWNLTEN